MNQLTDTSVPIIADYRYNPLRDNDSINRGFTLMDEIGKSDFVICLQDRKIRVIKSIFGNEVFGPVENLKSLINLLSMLIINFKHPVYLPTFDESVEIITKDKINNFLKEVLG